jgi:2-oxoglutarate ferredoxin oxidoreductase subunit beta
MTYVPGDDMTFPEPVGVLRAIEAPVHHEAVDKQMTESLGKKGKGDLQELLTGDEIWTVN